MTSTRTSGRNGGSILPPENAYVGVRFMRAWKKRNLLKLVVEGTISTDLAQEYQKLSDSVHILDELPDSDLEDPDEET